MSETTPRTPTKLEREETSGEGEQSTPHSKRRRVVQRRRIDDPLNYQDYLQIDKLLSCQAPKSAEAGQAAHDEHLFIVIHQVYELWFKQILHELDSIREIFSAEFIEEKLIGLAVHRLTRVNEIQKVLVQQLTVLETMTPLEFLDFRDFLFPASGFQSVQFRMVENKLGLRRDDRIQYGHRGYCTYLRKQDQAVVESAEKQDSLFVLVERWLERTPFLHLGEFDFWRHYQNTVQSMLDEDRRSIRSNSGLDAATTKAQLDAIDEMQAHFDSIINPDLHERLVKRGDRRLSHRAIQAALLITLYQDEPMLSMPHRLLQVLQDVDEHMTLWRYRHALMVHRMLGVKIGTGGSSGYHYLRSTAARHKIFGDLFNLSTFLIPKASLAPLPPKIANLMGYTTRRSEASGGVASHTGDAGTAAAGAGAGAGDDGAASGGAGAATGLPGASAAGSNGEVAARCPFGHGT